MGMSFAIHTVDKFMIDEGSCSRPRTTGATGAGGGATSGKAGPGASAKRSSGPDGRELELAAANTAVDDSGPGPGPRPSVSLPAGPEAKGSERIL